MSFIVLSRIWYIGISINRYKFEFKNTKPIQTWTSADDLTCIDFIWLSFNVTLNWFWGWFLTVLSLLCPCFQVDRLLKSLFSPLLKFLPLWILILFAILVRKPVIYDAGLFGIRILVPSLRMNNSLPVSGHYIPSTWRQNSDFFISSEARNSPPLLGTWFKCR